MYPSTRLCRWRPWDTIRLGPQLVTDAEVEEIAAGVGDAVREVPDELLAPLFGAAREVAAVVKDVLGVQGSFVAMNNTVSQSVPHLHAHVVPRTKGDGLRGFFWPRVTYAEGEAQDSAVRLRVGLDGADLDGIGPDGAG